MIIGCLCLVALFLSPLTATANNLSISNVSIKNRDTSAQTVVVEFDISWDNAWKDVINTDGVWIFIKSSQDGGTTWSHATLKSSGTNPSGFSRGSKAGGSILSIDLVVPPDKKGCFIQPAYYGSGTLNFTDIQLLWAYGNDGVSDADVIHATNSKVKVFGVEMVYIPQGGFYAGDTSSNAAFRQGSADSRPWFIPNENAIHVTGVAAGGYYYAAMDFIAGEDTSGSEFWISGEYPKGYKAFYLMKYEMSQQQYVDFLNSLTRTQQASRVASNISADTVANYYVMHNTNAVVNRDTIRCPASGNGTTNPIVFSADRPARAANYLSWMDLMAYADWAGLRPMTELEYEKAARGSVGYVAGEYAWGSTSITACATVSGSESGAETCSTSNANANYNNTTFTGGDGGSGPLRVGIFATSLTTTRQPSGAGYFGNLELSGNVWERTVTVGNAAGRVFLGTHGDGELSSSGYATNADWPGYASGEITDSAGSGLRGGAWFYLNVLSTVAFRYYAAASYSSRNNCYGGRLARTVS
ncbi:MAG: formylglycine-generating enzyme family protein [Candidatus Omnitrophica bacterium]|nr:formylglycine-generating enzyme family protein [Candidatus Omnitrophota bacterium]